jgi:outer membrane lipoprotein carrier protein
LDKVLTIAALLLLAAAAAADEDARGHELVDAFVHDVETFAGRFEQTLVSAEGEVLEVTRGTLEIQRPGRFRWSYTEPYEQYLVADGLNVWNYDVDLAQVTVKPQAEALASTPALLLGGSADAMQQFDFEGSREDGDTTWVELQPVDTESGFRGVELGFSGDTLRRMVFFDNLEQTTVVNLEDVTVNQPIDPQQFVFAVPDDVDVVGQAAAVATTP